MRMFIKEELFFVIFKLGNNREQCGEPYLHPLSHITPRLIPCSAIIWPLRKLGQKGPQISVTSFSFSLHCLVPFGKYKVYPIFLVFWVNVTVQTKSQFLPFTVKFLQRMQFQACLTAESLGGMFKVKLESPWAPPQAHWTKVFSPEIAGDLSFHNPYHRDLARLSFGHSCHPPYSPSSPHPTVSPNLCLRGNDAQQALDTFPQEQEPPKLTST